MFCFCFTVLCSSLSDYIMLYQLCKLSLYLIEGQLIFVRESLFKQWKSLSRLVDVEYCSWTKQQPNLAILRSALNLFHGELTGEKHISSYQSNRKWRVSSCTPNQDRSYSEMCLGIVPISLSPTRLASFPAPWAGRRGISLYDGFKPQAFDWWAKKSSPVFVTCLLGFNTAGCLSPD